MFTVLVFHDGRSDYLEQTLGTFSDQVSFPERPYKILIDDMPEGRDVDFLEKIATRFAFNELILNEHNLGSFGSIMKAWSCLPPATEYIFHLENDFVFPSKVDVCELTAVLEESWICNITLLRQAWYSDELEVGSILKTRPKRFREAVVCGIPVCLHQDYFGHNPGLYRRSFVRVIPDTSRLLPGRLVSHEVIYRDLLLAEDPNRHFAILGRLTDAPRVIHIGQRRVGQSPSHEHDLVQVDNTNLMPESQGLDLERQALLRSIDRLENEIREFLQPALSVRKSDLEAVQEAVNLQRRLFSETQNQLTALRNSRSWKITAPLRMIYDALASRRMGAQ